MKEKLAKSIEKALEALKAAGELGDADIPEVQLAIPKQAEHGDYACNIAMMLAKKAGKNPRELAGRIVETLGDGGGLIERTEIAGPGFLNFFLKSEGLFDVVKTIATQGEAFGRSDAGAGKRVMVEFVSANPTGPLHVGHGRGAVIGDVLANLLAAAGYAVHREYYINDAGVQMNNLGRSTYLRYRQLIEGTSEPLPEGLYQGDYIVEYAKELRAGRGDGIGEDAIGELTVFTATKILDMIRADLDRLGIRFDEWFSEKTLHDGGQVREKLDGLRARDLAYEKDGALWFRTEQFGDDKDRVLVKSGGEKTYLAADVAYHANKIDRGFDELVDIWGADHHGYVARMKAAIQALGKPPEMLTVMLIQMVNLVRGGERVSMSTRAGSFVTLRELVDEAGKDATRYFFLMRRYDSQLDFDVDLAKEKSNQNPVFYVQYMHARICSVFAKAAEEGVSIPDPTDVDFSLLTAPEEVQIAQQLAELPNVIERAARDREPHRLVTYIYDLASTFHPYYFQHRVITDDAALTAARLALYAAIRQVTQNVLALMGIDAPESM
ncbi:MAG: arginine--tRNA ligase [Deltaproteobacteria bacterium]|nr:arginine--tRNA ligase [Deltaproteobacteria bacterium]